MNENQYKVIKSTTGDEVYRDSLDHFTNGFLRLMNLPEKLIEDFIQEAAGALLVIGRFDLQAISIVLHKSWQKISGCNIGSGEVREISIELDTCYGVMHFDKFVELAKNQELGVAINQSKGFGVLVHSSTMTRVKNAETSYEESYFDGNLPGVGYGDFSEQPWRLEKAVRQVEELVVLMNKIDYPIKMTDMSFLDIGSGYGHFIKALQNQGSSGKGLDISQYASDMALKQLGVETVVDTLESFSSKSRDKFHAITMWDYIEHPDDPGLELKFCRKILKDDGLLFIKTPSIEALEFDVFTSHYHSLKHEHLNYFSLRSLTSLLVKNGFSLVYSQGISHLLSGFKDLDISSLARGAQKESDIFLIAKKV